MLKKSEPDSKKGAKTIPEFHAILCTKEIRIVSQTVDADEMPESVAVNQSV